MISASFLEHWLAPIDLASFRNELIAHRVLYAPATRERLETVAARSSWDVEELLAGGGVKPLAWFQSADGRHLTSEVGVDTASKLYRAGTTLYLKEIEPVRAIGDAIARELDVPRHRIQCAVFCNQPGARTQAHFDPVDTLTVQLKGHKRWRLAPNRLVSQPTTGWATKDGSAKKAELWLYANGTLPAALPDGAEEYLLEPGALLHVPRGHWHETESGEPSVSLHVHHAPLPWVDTVLVTLRSLLLRDPQWREGADRLWDPQATASNAHVVERLLRSLGTAIDELGVDDVLVLPSARTKLDDPATRLVRRARSGFVIERAADAGGTTTATFTVAEYGTERRTTIEMSPAYLTACQLFLVPGSLALSADELGARVPGLGSDDARRLVAVLLDVGFLRPA